MEEPLKPLNQIQTEPTSLPSAAGWSAHRRPKRLGLWLSALVVFLIIFAVGVYFYRPVLKVDGALEGAVITLDKTRVYPPVRTAPGRHTIEITKPGYVPYRFSGKIAPFSRFKLSLALRPLPSPKLVVSDEAFSMDFSPKDKKIFYLGEGGKTIYQLQFLPRQTNTEQKIERSAITPSTLSPLKKIVFSPNYQLAMFSRQDGDTGLYDFKKYDLLNQDYRSWGKDIGDLVWSPDGEQIAYYYAPKDDGVLVISDRAHKKVERAYDLRSAGIGSSASDPQAPELAWSPDGKLILIVANNSLYLMDVSTKTLTRVVEAGVSEAIFSPDSRHLLYTRNQKLEYIEFELVNSLSGIPEDQENVGKIKVGEPVLIDLSAFAKKAVFTPDQNRVIAVGANGVYNVDLAKKNASRYFSAGEPGKIKDIGLSPDGKVLYGLTENQLIALELDDGKY